MTPAFQRMRPILILIASAACVGCAIGPTIMHDNYLFYDYTASDNADAAVRANAEAICGQRKQIAIRTEYMCGPARCRTNYQCVDETDARELGLLPRPAK